MKMKLLDCVRVGWRAVRHAVHCEPCGGSGGRIFVMDDKNMNVWFMEMLWWLIYTGASD